MPVWSYVVPEQARAGDAAAAFAGAREEGRNRAAEELSALKLLLEAQVPE